MVYKTLMLIIDVVICVMSFNKPANHLKIYLNIKLVPYNFEFLVIF